jgi:hypothetical protein
VQYEEGIYAPKYRILLVDHKKTGIVCAQELVLEFYVRLALFNFPKNPGKQHFFSNRPNKPFVKFFEQELLLVGSFWTSY